MPIASGVTWPALSPVPPLLPGSGLHGGYIPRSDGLNTSGLSTARAGTGRSAHKPPGYSHVGWGAYRGVGAQCARLLVGGANRANPLIDAKPLGLHESGRAETLTESRPRRQSTQAECQAPSAVGRRGRRRQAIRLYPRCNPLTATTRQAVPPVRGYHPGTTRYCPMNLPG
jgi:hypothetical protein